MGGSVRSVAHLLPAGWPEPTQNEQPGDDTDQQHDDERLIGSNIAHVDGLDDKPLEELIGGLRTGSYILAFRVGPDFSDLHPRIKTGNPAVRFSSAILWPAAAPSDFLFSWKRNCDVSVLRVSENQ